MKNDYIWVRYTLYVVLFCAALFFVLHPIFNMIEVARTNSDNVNPLGLIAIIADWVKYQLAGLALAAVCGFTGWVIYRSKIGYHY